MKTIRIIKNRWGTGTNAMMRMKAQCGDSREILWGKPIQTGPDSWHVYGAHRKWWLPVNVEFTPKMITFVFPKGVRGKKKIYSANVPDEVSLLASGTKACSAGDVPEVPKAQGLTPSAR